MSELPMEPLAIWPWPAPPEQLEVVRRAYLALKLPFPVQPSPAVPGGPVRVLALGSMPPFVCDSALIGDPLSFESVRNGLEWVLDAKQDVERGYTVLDCLRSLLGSDVREVDFLIGDTP